MHCSPKTDQQTNMQPNQQPSLPVGETVGCMTNSYLVKDANRSLNRQELEGTTDPSVLPVVRVECKQPPTFHRLTRGSLSIHWATTMAVNWTLFEAPSWDDDLVHFRCSACCYPEIVESGSYQDQHRLCRDCSRTTRNL